jgi:hypothetical protein
MSFAVVQFFSRGRIVDNQTTELVFVEGHSRDNTYGQLKRDRDTCRAMLSITNSRPAQAKVTLLAWVLHGQKAKC